MSGINNVILNDELLTKIKENPPENLANLIKASIYMENSCVRYPRVGGNVQGYILKHDGKILSYADFDVESDIEKETDMF